MATQDQHWVTINGRHILMGGHMITGGGHKGTHNPAMSTGNKHADQAMLKHVDEMNAVVKEPRNRWVAMKQKNKLATYW